MKKITIKNGIIYEGEQAVDLQRLIKLLEEDIQNITCPFCKENDFDAIGLKSHISHGDCEKYNKIDISGLKRMF